MLHGQSLYTYFNILCSCLQTHQTKVGAHMWGTALQKDCTVKARKQIAHKFSRAENGLLAPKKFEHLCMGQTILVVTHNCCIVHKQGRGHEVRLSVPFSGD